MARCATSHQGAVSQPRIDLQHNLRQACLRKPRRCKRHSDDMGCHHCTSCHPVLQDWNTRPPDRKSLPYGRSLMQYKQQGYAHRHCSHTCQLCRDFDHRSSHKRQKHCCHRHRRRPLRPFAWEGPLAFGGSEWTEELLAEKSSLY